MQRKDRVNRLAAGATLPSIALPATGGPGVGIARLPGRSLIIVYPWTGRPGHPNPPGWDHIPGAHGSTPELVGFRDRNAEFARRGVRLFALSRQATEYQREMAQRLKLPFPVLSDAGGRFSAALCLPTFETGGVTYLRRLTLLAETGRIAHLFYPVPDPALHARQVLNWLDQNQSTSSSASSTE